jgi:hypothetical protein
MRDFKPAFAVGARPIGSVYDYRVAGLKRGASHRVFRFPIDGTVHVIESVGGDGVYQAILRDMHRAAAVAPGPGGFSRARRTD